MAKFNSFEPVTSFDSPPSTHHLSLKMKPIILRMSLSDWPCCDVNQVPLAETQHSDQCCEPMYSGMNPVRSSL